MTEKGFRYRTRCCSNAENESDGCDEDYDVIECTPRKCTDVECNCDWGSESFGLKNGICSSKHSR